MQQLMDQLAANESTAYLAAVEELTLELQRAIVAIAQGALSEFEDSLVRQRIGCMHIAELASLHGDMATPPVEYDSSILQSTREAFSDLKEVTLHYAMMLKHFGDTTRLFAGVFRTYGAPAKDALHLPRVKNAWSCEL